MNLCVTSSFRSSIGIARAESGGTCAETRFRLSTKRTSPFKSVGASVQSTAGSRGVRISFSNAGYTTFGGGMRVLVTHSIRQFPLHFPSRALTVCHHIPNAVYQLPAFFTTVRLSNMAEGNRAFSYERNRSLNNFPNHRKPIQRESRLQFWLHHKSSPSEEATSDVSNLTGHPRHSTPQLKSFQTAHIQWAHRHTHPLQEHSSRYTTQHRTYKDGQS